jgi:hypothetical protein
MADGDEPPSNPDPCAKKLGSCSLRATDGDAIGTAIGHPAISRNCSQLIEKAVPFLEVEDGANALRILESIAEAFVDDWLHHSHDSDEHLYALFADLGRLMAEGVSRLTHHGLSPRRLARAS